MSFAIILPGRGSARRTGRLWGLSRLRKKVQATTTTMTTQVFCGKGLGHVLSAREVHSPQCNRNTPQSLVFGANDTERSSCEARGGGGCN